MRILFIAVCGFLLCCKTGWSTDEKRVAVFLLIGQSNMEGHGRVSAEPQRNDGKGSLQWLAENRPDSAFARLRNPDGTWRQRDDVWVHYLQRHGRLQAGFGVQQDRMGPELGFGTVIGDALKQPVLLVKLAWGGKSLAQDFRPPSAGGTGTGAYYNEVLQRAQAVLANPAADIPELKGYQADLQGIGWHQGWNDRVNQAFNDEYESNMAHFIRDIRRDLKAPDLPFVIAETGMSGEQEKHPRALSLMKAQAAVATYPEFQGTVAFVGTRSFYRTPEESPLKQEYHWNGNAETYYLIGEGMGQAMLKLLK
ncbi:MAG TPA: sialate O-acetylesterase [Planctomycetaceae bacterium]|nr:sialate O-acetylesterase [Planctomycetaceae bacterium]